MSTPKRIYLTPLSGKQIKHLCMLANEAFKAAKARPGAVDDHVTAEMFRKEGQLEAVGKASLKDCHQGDYLELVGKWFTVIGNLEAAFYAFMDAGAAAEHRRQMAWRLMGQVYALSCAMAERENTRPGVPMPQQAWEYTRSICRDKFKGLAITSLDGFQLEQLGFTVVSRANAMRGVGSTRTRNTSQAKRRGVKASEEAFQRPLKAGVSAPFCAGLSVPEASRQDESADSRLPTDARLG